MKEILLGWITKPKYALTVVDYFIGLAELVAVYAIVVFVTAHNENRKEKRRKEKDEEE